MSPSPFTTVPIPDKHYRAAFWCASWDSTTQSPILGKAIYTYKLGLHFQHWVPVLDRSSTQTSLTPTSSKLKLRECEGCHLNANYIARRTSTTYLDLFPCKITCAHNDVVKLPIIPTARFDREITLKFNTMLSNLTLDIRACYHSSAVVSSSPLQSSLISYDFGRLALSFTHLAAAYHVNTDAHFTVKSIFDAINFNTILHLKRWQDIKVLLDRSDINWIATWALFGFHFNERKVTTSFKHSSAISFCTKLLMEELPLLDKLVKRNPEVYKEEWKCMLCDQEQESWSHIWRCPHLLNRLIALQQATKQGFEDLLSVTVPNRSATFVFTWNALPCWSLPLTSSNATVTF